MHPGVFGEPLRDPRPAPGIATPPPSQRFSQAPRPETTMRPYMTLLFVLIVLFAVIIAARIAH